MRCYPSPLTPPARRTGAGHSLPLPSARPPPGLPYSAPPYTHFDLFRAGAGLLGGDWKCGVRVCVGLACDGMIPSQRHFLRSNPSQRLGYPHLRERARVCLRVGRPSSLHVSESRAARGLPAGFRLRPRARRPEEQATALRCKLSTDPSHAARTWRGPSKSRSERRDRPRSES